MAARKDHRVFSEAEKKAALEFAAVHGYRAAGRAFDVSHVTIMNWTAEFPELWSDLRAGNEEAHKLGFARRLEDLAEAYGAAEAAALERANKLLPRADAKETAALIKAMGSSRGVATAGARAVLGEPNERSEITINVPALERAMERLLESAPQPALPVANLAEEDGQSV